MLELEPKEDGRGFFARVYCEEEFRARGLATRFVQCNMCHNHRKGTLRGLHYQVPPFEEVKLVTCVRGAIYDVMVDLRRQSPTYKQWAAVTLSAQNHRLLYIPRGCAHGYQTLEDDTTVFYMVSEFYHPESERGAKWDDPAFGVRWPMRPTSISAKDCSWPEWTDPP